MSHLHVTCHKVAEWTLIILAGLLPIAVIPVDWIQVTHSKSLLISVALIVAVVLWVAGAVAEGVVRIPKSLLFVVAACLPIAYSISAFLTNAPWSSYVSSGASVDTVAAMATFYFLFVVIASLYAHRNSVPLMYALYIGGSVLVLFSIVRLFELHEWFNLGGALTGVATSVVGSWHDLGIFLVFFAFLILTTVYTVIERRLVKSVLYLFLGTTGFLLVVINLSDVWYSVAALFGAYGVFLFFVSCSREVGQRAMWQQAALYLLIAVVALGLGYGGVWIKERLPDTLKIAYVEVRPSWQGTFAVGERALTKQELFFGTGPNTFARDWGLYKPQHVNLTNFWRVDFYAGVGAVPTTVVTVGLFGAFAWGLIIASLLVLAFRYIARKDPLGVALISSALFLTAFHVLYTPGITLSTLTFILYAIIVARAAYQTGAVWSLPIGPTSIRESIALAVLCAIGLSSIFIGVQSLRVFASDVLVGRSEDVFSETGDTHAAALYIAQANAIYPGNDKAHRAAVELGFLELRNLAAQGVGSKEAQQKLQQVLSETIEHGLAAAAADGENYQNWLLLARLYGELAGSRIAGAEASARQAYERARITNPTSPLPFVGLAQMELVLGNRDVARELLSEALLLKSNLPLAHFLLSQIEVSRGDLVRARKEAAVVVELVPEDSLAWYNLGTILYAEKNFDAAVTALKHTLALKENYANALFILALSYHELGRVEEALAMFETLKTVDPSSTAPGQAIKNIQDGRAPFVPLLTE